jgi:hypothetical protein
MAALIHWIVENYALVKNLLFGWLPFHIPPEWHDYILLFFIIFSVTNVGFYQRTGRIFAKQLYLMLPFWDDPERAFEATPLSNARLLRPAPLSKTRAISRFSGRARSRCHVSRENTGIAAL